MVHLPRAVRAAARRHRPPGRLQVVVWSCVLVVLTSCAGRDPGPDAAETGSSGSGGFGGGAESVAEQFVRERADLSRLLMRLRPADTDYDDVFADDIVIAALRHYDGYWRAPRVLGPTPTQTEYRITVASKEELEDGTGAAAEFPGGYREIAPHLLPGVGVHRITFHEPGVAWGIDVDGLIEVDGRWRLFPTPWLVLSVDEPGHQH